MPADANAAAAPVDEWLTQFLEAEHPDLITTHGGHRIVTAAAFAEMMRRLEVEIASLEAVVHSGEN